MDLYQCSEGTFGPKRRNGNRFRLDPLLLRAGMIVHFLVLSEFEFVSKIRSAVTYILYILITYFFL